MLSRWMKKDCCKGAREDEGMAGADKEHGCYWGALWQGPADLGWEVRLWRLQLVLSTNRPSSFARKQRENSLLLPWLWHWASIASPRAQPLAQRSHSSKMPLPRCLKCLLQHPVTRGPSPLTGFCSLQVSGWEGGVFHEACNRKLALTSTTERLTPFQNDVVCVF